MDDFYTIKDELLDNMFKSDLETYYHSIKVGQYSLDFAKYLNLPNEEVYIAYISGELHDIGKIFIPKFILKKKGKLTDEEYELIKKHPELGYCMFTSFFLDRNDSFLKKIANAILGHHQFYNGKEGYPKDVSLEHSIITSIVSLCDVYDALTSERAYKHPYSKEKAIQIMNMRKGTQFSPDLLDEFINFLNISKYRQLRII